MVFNSELIKSTHLGRSKLLGFLRNLFKILVKKVVGHGRITKLL